MSTDSSLLPRQGPVETDVEGELVALDDAGSVIDALSSGTTRELLTELYDQPSTASDLADEVDTSMQNVDYHLGKLHDAGLVEVVDTWYSSRGAEMDVYAPTSDPLMVFVGRSTDEPAVTEVLPGTGSTAQAGD